MTTFYFFRHGETLFNVKDFIQGWCDSPLTKNGESQAQQTSQLARSLDLDMIYSSDLMRAYHTAQILFPHHSIQMTPALREFHFGTKEGDRNPTLCEGMHHFDFNICLRIGWHRYGGENYDDVIQRVMYFLEEVSKTYPEGKIGIVTHGCTIAALCDYADPVRSLQYRMNHQEITNCSLTVFTYNQGKLELKDYAISQITD